MDWKYKLLAECGYQIITAAGEYCCACRDDRDVILRWDGDCWIVL